MTVARSGVKPQRFGGRLFNPNCIEGRRIFVNRGQFMYTEGSPVYCLSATSERPSLHTDFQPPHDPKLAVSENTFPP